MRNGETNMISILSAFIIGGLIGAGIALLMAPQSGTETRNMLMNKGSELRDRANDTIEDTRSRATKAINDAANQTKDRAASLKKQGQKVLDR